MGRVVSQIGRRQFLIVAGLLVGAPVVRAQTAGAASAFHIGVLRGAPDSPLFRANLHPFIQELAENGFRENENLAVEYRIGLAHGADLVARARELVRAGPRAILAAGPDSTVAAAQATREIAIVAVDLETDPVAAGLVKTLGRPGGNVTGLFLDMPELCGKWLQLLKEVVPRLARVAVLWDSTTGPYQRNGAAAAARSTRVEASILEVKRAEDIDAAMKAASNARVDGLIVLSSPMLNSSRRHIVALASQYRLPAIYLFPETAEEGGLLAYGPVIKSLFRQAGGVMVKILRGARPGDIPIERPTKFEFAINLKTAKALGISLSPALLFRADRVIE